MKKILITGITGFVGYYIVQELLGKEHNSDFEIHGTTKSLHESDLPGNVTLHEIDLLNKQEVLDLISFVKPDYIYHLAALTSPSESFKHPLESIHDNSALQLNIFESIRELGITPRILIPSSGEVYGKVDAEDLPVNERAELKPMSPYGVSKITQDYLALQYHLSYGLDVIRVRPFNHIGARQSEHFVVPAFAKQIAEIEKGKKDPVITVGNLESARDFTDVRDIVHAYSLLMEKGIAGDVYNIGSGKSYKIQEVLDMLLAMSDKEIKIEEDPKLLRPSDIKDIVCDNSKVKETTGWEPKIPIQESLQDTLDYWRSVV